MNVVYVSNEAYVRHFAVSFVLLCNCNPDEEELTVYFLGTDTRAETAEKLQALATDFGRELILLPYENLEECFPERPDTEGFNPSTLGRFFLGELLPSKMKCVPYLDCDAVVQRSLYRVCTADLRGALPTMVEEPAIYHEVRAYLRILPEASYFSVDVILVDLACQRAEDIGRQLFDYYGSIASYCPSQDQGAINGLLRGRITTLHPAYNFIINYRYFSYTLLEVFSPTYREIGERRFEATKRHPAILRYAGDERPRWQGTYNPYERAYLRYLVRTPWRDAAPEGGKQAYLLCYHGMNPLTRHFPSLHFAIGRRYVKESVEKRRWGMREAGKV